VTFLAASGTGAGADAGANAVIGHHTHIISGHEVYKEAPIFYSLGNFCFDWEGLRNLPWNKGMIVRLGFEKGKKISKYLVELEVIIPNKKTINTKVTPKYVKI
jgi:poly-gamma-glutamate capsule biosynthesis protein CapA/YwtB (metallophosphatase superfamily)